MIENIRIELLNMADPAYKAFQSKQIPTVNADLVIGIRTPMLRAYAKNMDMEDAQAFMQALPHKYYEENNLHAFLIERIKDIDCCLEALDRFLPYVDNWATCDGMKPKCLMKNKSLLKSKCIQWMQAQHTYTVRYGILMLMTHFLDKDFSEDCLSLVSHVESSEYYINMMIAWYFATALAKQWENAIVYLREKRLNPWAHNKTIQKAIESYRISPERKTYLRSLRV